MPDDMQGGDYRMQGNPDDYQRWQQGVNVPQNQAALAPASPLALDDVNQRAAQEAGRERRELAGPVAALSRLEQHKPGVPQLQMNREPPPDAANYRKNAMEYASAFAVLGAIASKFTRAPGGAGLSAFAGAMQGWQEGNLQAYQQASDRWEQQSRQALENNRTILQQYALVLNDHNKNIDEQMSSIQLIAAQYHDKLMFDAAAAKNYTMVAKLYDKGSSFTDKGQRAVDTMAASKAEEEAKYSLIGERVATRQYGFDPDAEVNPRNGQPYTQQEIAQLRQAEQFYLTHQPKGGRGGGVSGVRMSARNEIIQSYIRDHGGEYPSEDYIANELGRQQGISAAARVSAAAEPRADANALTRLTQQQTAIQAWEKTAIANGEKLKQLAKEVDRTGYPAIEGWIRAGRMASGDPKVAAFNAQMEVYRAEVAKIISNPNLTGQLTDSARREVQNFMAGGASASQIIAVVDLLKQDFGRRENAIENERQVLLTRLRGGGKGGEATTPATAQPTGGGANDPLGIR